MPREQDVRAARVVDRGFTVEDRHEISNSPARDFKIGFMRRVQYFYRPTPCASRPTARVTSATDRTINWNCGRCCGSIRTRMQQRAFPAPRKRHEFATTGERSCASWRTGGQQRGRRV